MNHQFQQAHAQRMHQDNGQAHAGVERVRAPRQACLSQDDTVAWPLPVRDFAAPGRIPPQRRWAPRLRTAAGRAVILVLHDLTLASRFCDRVLLLNQGRAVAFGAPGAVRTPSAH